MIDCSSAIDWIAEQKVQEFGTELLNAARKSMSLGNGIAASGILVEFLSMREDFEARRMLAQCYELMGLGERAYHEYTKLLRIYPYDNLIRLRCIFLKAYYLDQVAEAYSELEELMRRDPSLISNNLAMRVVAMNSLLTNIKVDCVNSYYSKLGTGTVDEDEGVHFIDLEIKQRLSEFYKNV